MYTIVFSKEDKDKLIQNGGTFLGEQKIGDNVTYLFKNSKNINFDKLNITYEKTNDVLF